MAPPHPQPGKETRTALLADYLAGRVSSKGTALQLASLILDLSVSPDNQDGFMDTWGDISAAARAGSDADLKKSADVVVGDSRYGS